MQGNTRETEPNCSLPGSGDKLPRPSRRLLSTSSQNIPKGSEHPREEEHDRPHQEVLEFGSEVKHRRVQFAQLEANTLSRAKRAKAGAKCSLANEGKGGQNIEQKEAGAGKTGACAKYHAQGAHLRLLQ